MKKSAILGIFNGTKGHFETMNMPNEKKKYAEKVSDIFDALKEKLSPECLKLHEEFVEALEANWSEDLDFFFAEGFKLGLQIGIECFEE